MERDYLRLRSLSSFLQTFFLPAASACEDAADATVPAALNKANFLEAYSWLDLGVRAGIYPVDAAEEVVGRYFWLLPGRDDEIARVWRHLFPAMVTRVDTALGTKRLFEGGVPWPEEIASELGPLFDILCHTAAGFVMNRITSALTHAQVFLSVPEFETTMSTLTNSELVIRALRDGWVNDRKPRILAGYIQAIQHMDAFASVLQESRRDPVIELGHWALFRMAIYDIHSWRLNFVNEAIDKRFDEIGQDVERTLIGEAERVGITLPMGGLMAAVEPIKRRWAQLSEPATLSGAV